MVALSPVVMFISVYLQSFLYLLCFVEGSIDFILAILSPFRGILQVFSLSGFMTLYCRIHGQYIVVFFLDEMLFVILDGLDSLTEYSLDCQ